MKPLTLKATRKEDTIERRDRNTLLWRSLVLMWFAVCSIYSFLWTLFKAAGGALLGGLIVALVGSYLSPRLQYLLLHSLAQILLSTTQFLYVVQRTFLTNASTDIIDKVSDMAAPSVPTEILSSPTIFDVAQLMNGASIIPALTTPTAGLSTPSFLHKLHTVWQGVDISQIESNPPLVILEDTLTDCWRFQGRRGHVAISFADTDLLQSVSLNFPDQRLVTADRLRQAPRELFFWALASLEQVNTSYKHLLKPWQEFVTVEDLVDRSRFNSSVEFFRVASFAYDPLNGLQHFPLHHPVPTSTIVLEIMDNWGDESTCLHGVQVYGRSV
ncbi:hypothetical protein F5890DRAFT_1478565 [Lentinula detonsa]|uniref:SUN domain-containing protein n=1 Tax=Lentinula detonsa TaxID=2804962 RepID=A0AA38PPK1_9AGAR|nr:hypothetical protein F5890DRAFT_1478565 [Lentinula detonsa]